MLMSAQKSAIAARLCALAICEKLLCALHMIKGCLGRLSLAEKVCYGTWVNKFQKFHINSMEGEGN